MKRLPVLAFALILPALLSAQPASVRRILRKCDTGREVTRIHLPPVLFRLVSHFADDDGDRQIIDNMRCLYLVVSEDREYSRTSDFPSRVADKLRDLDFQEMLVARDKGEKVAILWRDRGHHRKEMVVAVDGDEDMVLYLRGKLDLDEMMKGESLKKMGVRDLAGILPE